MSKQALIQVFSGTIRDDEVQLVDARTLHQFLGVDSHFRTWVARRIKEYGFQDGEDFRSFLGESSGGRRSNEYHITLDMAKELSMVERNEKGRQARRYFIECEKRLRQIAPLDAEKIGSQTIGADGFRCLAAVVAGKVRALPAPVQRRAKAKLWAQVHAAFSVRSAQDIPATQLDAARNFVAAYAVEGEWLPQQKEGEFTLGYYEAQDINHLVHHVLWCVHRWSNGISAGVQAMNRPLWLSTFEHFQEMERTARRIERTQPALIGYFRERLSALRPDDCAAQGVLA